MEKIMPFHLLAEIGTDALVVILLVMVIYLFYRLTRLEDLCSHLQLIHHRLDSIEKTLNNITTVTLKE